MFPDFSTACTMIFDPDISILASSSAWLPLLYDTIIVGLTLYQTWPALRYRKSSFVMRRLLEDGLIYYIAIFSVTLVLTIMIIAAPPGLKNITAQLELLLTVAMMSRITLNLKKSAHKALSNDEVVYPSILMDTSLLFAKSMHYGRGGMDSSLPMTSLSPQNPPTDVSAEPATFTTVTDNKGSYKDESHRVRAL
ncbi:hypothetical protein D9615_003044 [Tricholomella constricta]|uniref:Uncharacterized protein n=1 Tax=Tricholomella constricta TaxID=117010 RepID=A0A8H5HFL9_9AGAR|nr:hypothetical protein D9615_003044 [Tricholomella constricta]